MGELTVNVERYRIEVSAVEALSNVMADFDTEQGQPWETAWDLLTDRRYAVFVVDHDTVTTHEDFNPRRTTEGIAHVEDDREDEVIAALYRNGYVTDHQFGRAWFEDEQASYFDQSFSIDTVTVKRAFRVVAVRYFDYGRLSLNLETSGYARQWVIEDEVEVPVGSYVIARHGDMYASSWRTHSVGYVEDETDLPSTEALADVEGFMGSHCSAGCTTCEASWFSDQGSWRFHVDSLSNDPTAKTDGFEFDDADLWDEGSGTIRCPACGRGRVGFSVY